MSRQRVACAALGVAAVVVTAGAVVAPVLEAHGSALAAWLRLPYGPVCHQQPDRCLNVAGGPMAVCARCIGAYLGGALALLAAALRPSRLPRSVLFVAVAINALDVGLGLLGLPSAGNGLRTALGTALGLSAGLVLAEGVRDTVPLRSQRSVRYPRDELAGARMESDMGESVRSKR